MGTETAPDAVTVIPAATPFVWPEGKFNVTPELDVGVSEKDM
jgi:hypothetical protein